MNKRGSVSKSIYLPSMAVLALIFGVVLFQVIVDDYLGNTAFWKFYYTRDIGMAMDIAQTERGNIELNYNLIRAEKPLVLQLQKQKIGLYDRKSGLQEPIVTYYRYATDKNIEIEVGELYATYFKMYFSDKVIFSEETLGEGICSDKNTTAVPGEIIIYVKAVNPSVEQLITAGLNGKGFKATNDLIENIDLALIIINGNKEEIKFAYYKQALKSEKLGCLIRNQLIEKNSDELFISQMKKIEDNSMWWPTLSMVDMGLVIITETNSNVVLSIIEGVNAYYG